MPLRWHLLLVSLIICVLIALVIPAMQGGSNCGGNSAALSSCREYLVVLDLWQDKHPGETFDFEHADAETQQYLRGIAGAGWISSAGLLARLDKVRIDPAGPKQVVIVCDRAYTNVPRHSFWSAPPTHAVGYSTGQTALISPHEFAALDLRGFVDLQPLQDH